MGKILESKLMADTCPFCDIDHSRIILQTPLAYAVRDGYPISQGHTLVIPHRHIASLFEATTQELDELISLLREAREKLIDELHPDGFNIGINDGKAAGQTVMHLHIHLIPRFGGDCPDPRGGVRRIFPEKAAYWSGRE